MKPSLPSLLADLGEERRAVRFIVGDLDFEPWARQGDAALEWMEIGQVFAGPPGPGPARVRGSKSGVR